MMTRHALLAAASILISLTLASCGEEKEKAAPAKAEEVAASQAPEEPSNDELRDYFAAVWSDDATKTKQAIKMAAPDSNAEAYAIYLAGASQSVLDSGQAEPRTEPVEEIEGGFKQCDRLDDGTDDCSEATDIVYVDGKIADFSTGGTPIGERLVTGTGKPHRLGDLGEATLIAAYRTAKGDLYAVFEIKSNANKLGINYDTNYIAPNGRQTQNGGVTAPTELGKGALANATLVFEGAEFGGKLRLNVYSAEGNFKTATAEFKIK